MQKSRQTENKTGAPRIFAVPFVYLLQCGHVRFVDKISQQSIDLAVILW
jgi:hypothetical protein